ncbi:MAG: phosphatase PAP2 family protein [Muribaculaceae bacterium]|nr:phosphatase PAP2 family protein [Muribaculaceae bacterium]
MITYLTSLDQQVLLAINGLHTAYLDQAMWLVSSRLSWLLILLAFLCTLRGKGWRHAALAILAIALTVLVADQVSSGLIKHLVERPRPTHEPALAGLVHTVNGYTGGPYGFVSSHAANAFGVALIIGLMMRSRTALWALVAWALLQCYSRVYLGVHYVGDILGGAIVGLLAAWLVGWLWGKAHRHWPQKVSTYNFTPNDGRLIAHAVAVTTISIAILAALLPIAAPNPS